jgi:hypothetical protein
VAEEIADLVIAVPTLAVALLAPVVVTLAGFLLDQLITNVGYVVLAPEDHPPILSVVNAVVAFARVQVARIEIP